jgi:uncharacterized metal-binding protein YceD (DUF177 family)
MNVGLPLSHIYNLNRLGQAGDEVVLAASEAERTDLARFTSVRRVERFQGRVGLKKLSANRFKLDFDLTADIVQACVVSLAEVPAHIERQFVRELQFRPQLRRPSHPPAPAEVSLEEDVPEEIDSLHYDLAAPLIEEFVLAIDPYPRAPGVAFKAPREGGEAPQSPFAILKGLKSGL